MSHLLRQEVLQFSNFLMLPIIIMNANPILHYINTWLEESRVSIKLDKCLQSYCFQIPENAFVSDSILPRLVTAIHEQRNICPLAVHDDLEKFGLQYRKLNKLASDCEMYHPKLQRLVNFLFIEEFYPNNKQTKNYIFFHFTMLEI